MFEYFKLKTRISELERELKDSNDDKDYLNDKVNKLEKEIIITEQDHEREISELNKTHEFEKNLAESNKKIEINDLVKAKNDENVLLKNENDVLKKEIEIIEKAFENLGFDVKDMKDILDKLVEGLVAKNEIRLLRTE